MSRPTENQMLRVTRDWSDIAKEPVKLEWIKGAMYAFGSELAALRLYYKMKAGRAEYSPNLATWFYCNE